MSLTQINRVIPMSGTILLERRLPLRWSLSDTAVGHIPTQQNQLIFTLLDHLDEPLLHKSDAGQTDELVRIETKLNIIMQLLGQFLQTQESPQTLHAIRFTSDTLAWKVEQALPVGSLLQVTVYPDQNIPLPVTFLASVIAVSDFWLEVDMHGLSEEELAIWSRWVFRQHRRQVAQTRTAGEAATSG